MRLTTVVLVLAACVVGHAQTLGPRLDKAALGLAGAWVDEAEFGGAPGTDWLAQRRDEKGVTDLKVVIYRNGRWCQGPWFTFDFVFPYDPSDQPAFYTVLHLHGTKMVYQGSRYVQTAEFVLPSC